MLQGRETHPLLLQQGSDAAKEDCACGEERLDCPAKEVGNGLGHDAQGQRVTRVEGCQACVLLGEPVSSCSANNCAQAAASSPERSRDRLANVESFYKRIRRHSSPGSVSPIAYEQLMGESECFGPAQKRVNLSCFRGPEWDRLHEEDHAVSRWLTECREPMHVC